jgi:hypothetical protein
MFLEGENNMNIFEILSSGDNGLNEVHVSSMLGWFLDPYHDHGLGIEVLKRLVSLTFEGTPLHREIIASEYSGVEMKGRRRIETSIILEKEVHCKESDKNRSIDIVVKINNKFILAVENKIRVSSKEHGQVKDEISGLLDDPDYKMEGIKEFYFIYLVKQSNELAYAAKELDSQLQVSAKPLSWINSNKNEMSMSKILQDILIDHNQGNINPVPTETLFLLRSFVRFAENGFSYYLGRDEQNIERYFYDDLKDSNQSCFVGFQGGIKALESNLMEAKTNSDERKRLLFRRPYKIVRNQPNDNWIPIKEFLDIFKKNGF